MTPWRCPYCHDRMARKFRRSHLRFEWGQRRLRRSGRMGELWDLPWCVSESCECPGVHAS